MRPDDFDLKALYAALDRERQTRGVSWAHAVREMSAPFTRGSSRPLSPSTVTSLRHKPVAEGDGVLQMLRWLNRAPESFVPGYPEADAAAARLPNVGPDRVLRFDTRKLHAALDARRLERGLTWKHVADEIGGVSVTSLMYLSKGGRTGFPFVARTTRWLGQPVVRFTRVTSR